MRFSLIVVFLSLVACENGRPAKSPDQQPSETFNEEEYGAVQSPEDNSPSTGYYGSQSSGPPDRAPAQPGGGHQPR
jgi:hypothetical protein